MNKVLVKILVVKTLEEYEVFLPVNKQIGDIICLLIKSLNELSNNVIPLEYNHLLFDTEQNLFYNPELSLKEANIDNGKTLILI